MRTRVTGGATGIQEKGCGKYIELTDVPIRSLAYPNAICLIHDT
jgi:hypothetical protein